MAKKNYNLLIGVAALVVIVLTISIVGYVVSRPKPIVIQGEAEATEYRISGKVPGRVEEFRGSEGSMVHKGDTLVFIDSPEIRSKIAEANAAKAAAVAQRNKAYNGAQQEQITGAYEIWQKALVGEDVMRKSYERMKALQAETGKMQLNVGNYQAAITAAITGNSKFASSLMGIAGGAGTWRPTTASISCFSPPCGYFTFRGTTSMPG